jgi:sialidase-1
MERWRWFISTSAAMLLVGSLPLAHGQAEGPAMMTLVPNTGEYPRNGEGDMIQLKDGRLLFAWTRFLAGGSDFSPAEIAAMTSADGGKTWSEPYVLQPNVGKTNVMEVGFLRLQNGEILFQYCVKDSEKTCSAWVRWSDDEAQTWSEPVRATNFEGYIATNNDRLVQLKSGRILIPVYGGWPGTIWSCCVYSDDNGRTWTKGADVWVERTGYGADEPAVIELKDGRVMMIIRTALGRIYRTYSSDGGQTFDEPDTMPLVSPNSPASIARIPSTGDLLIVWNNSSTERCPLNTAISRDEGKTWENYRTLEWGPGSFCYTSIDFVDDNALLTYYAPGGLRLTTVPVAWFYQPEPPVVWRREGAVSGEQGAWDLADNGAVWLQDRPEEWRGDLDSEVSVRVRVVSTAERATATAMLWVGSAAPNDSCALYFRKGPRADQISFAEDFAAAYDLPDAGQLHSYRVKTNHAARTAEVFVDDAAEPALTALLSAVLGYDINRLLLGDPNVGFLSGESQWRELRWRNGPEGEWRSVGQ